MIRQRRVTIGWVACAVLAAPGAMAQQPVSFRTEDGARITADFYAGYGRRAIVLAHGGRYAKGSWIPRLTRIQSDYEGVPPPRELLVVEGSAHAQGLFDTAESQRVFDSILRFLQEP